MAGYHRNRGPLRVLLIAGFLGATQILGQVLAPSRAIRGLLWSFSFAFIGGLALALLNEMDVKRRFPYTLLVSGDCITEVHPTFEKSVRKDELKTAAETSRFAVYHAGLRISKYGRFGMWLLDRYIWIPKSLPEYASVRDMVLSWKTPAVI